jgi:AraC-like DNA-binding protein
LLIPLRTISGACQRMRPSWRWTSSGRARIVQQVEQVVEATGLDAAHELLSAAYGNMRLSGGERRAMLRMATRSLGQVRFDQVDLRLGLEVDSEPTGSYVFGYLTAGRTWYRSDGEERRHARGDVFLTVLPDSPYTAGAEDPHASMVVLSRDVVEEVAGDVRFLGCRPLSPRAAAAWRSMCLLLQNEVPQVFGSNPLVVANAARLLVATTLATFPNSTFVHPTSSDRRDARPQALRRAMTFIEDNAASDITAADIARAARVSIRAMQLAFRRHLDMTPMAYLRSVRLSCAHRDLKAGNGSVTAIAARWGYARPSVFAAHYRAAYGVSPSQTLRSR